MWLILSPVQSGKKCSAASGSFLSGVPVAVGETYRYLQSFGCEHLELRIRDESLKFRFLLVLLFCC